MAITENTYSEFIRRYETEMIDEVFALESLSSWLENNKSGVKLDFDRVGYVEIANILVDGLGDYKDADTIVNGVFDDHSGTHSTGYGWQTGHASVEWTIYQLPWVRGKKFNIGRIKDEKSAKLMMGNTMTQFTRTQVVPEVDTCRFSALASYASASLGNLVSEAASGLSDHMVEKLLAAEMKLKELGIAKSDAMLLISTTAYNALRLDPLFVNYITQEDQKRGDRTFKIEKFDEMEIKIVPSDRFYTNVTLDSYNGYHPSSDSKLINYMIVSKGIGTAIRKYEHSQVYDSQDTFIGFDGWVLTYTLFHGLIVPKNKVPGLIVSVDTAAGSTKANKLFIKEVAGNTTNGFVVENFYTIPQGLRGRLYYDTNSNAASYTLGTAISGIQTATEISVDVEKVESTITDAIFALVDDNGKIVAVSDKITLVKKA